LQRGSETSRPRRCLLITLRGFLLVTVEEDLD
jgi:hypothetical protein